MNALPVTARNPTLWLVMAIPLATLFAGYLTLRLAYAAGESDEVPDDVARSGQAQSVELGPDRAAARAGLRVSISIDRRAGRIRATQDAGAVLPAKPVELQFVHPLRANEDSAVALLPAGAGWSAAAPGLADSDWQLVLVDADHQWRLVGRLPRRATAVTLRPSLSP